MRGNDSTLREADQDDRTMPTVVLFRRPSAPRQVEADDECPPEPDDFDPGPAAA